MAKQGGAWVAGLDGAGHERTGREGVGGGR
jgi:hypothetical protein